MTMPCNHPFNEPCAANTHQLKWKCFQSRPETCTACEKETKRLEKQARLDLEAQEQREAAQRQHELDMTELEAQLQFEREKAADIQAAKDRDDEKRQKMKEIEDAKKKLKNAAKQASQTSASTAGPGNVNSTPPQSTPSTSNQPQSSGNNISAHLQSSTPAPSRPSVSSPARDKWEHQKRVDGVQNDAIDKIMDLTGLEEVKEQILRIKAKIDMMKRQGVSLDKERLNLVLLGNPGTGQLHSLSRLFINALPNQVKRRLRGCMRNFWNLFKSCLGTRFWKLLGRSYPLKESEERRL